MEEIVQIKKDIEEIKERNRRVEKDKANQRSSESMKNWPILFRKIRHV